MSDRFRPDDAHRGVFESMNSDDPLMADTIGPVDTSFRTAVRRLDTAGRV